LGRGLFAKLCVDIEAACTALLYNCETCWLSHARMLHRVFELKEEIAIFINDCNNSNNSNVFYI
jgi:hypothetical protein